MIDVDRFMKILKNVLTTLSDREAYCVIMRMCGKSFKEIGVDLDRLPEWVRMADAKAMKKLRHPSRARYFDSFMEMVNVNDHPETVKQWGRGGYIHKVLRP